MYQDNWQRVWELVKSDPQLYAAFGLHPVYLEQHRPEHLLALGDWLSRLRGDRQLCAVGEFGLDYYVAELDRERQQALFEAQLQLAVDFDLPALLHVRRSHADVIARLKRFKLARGGIVHAFAGSYEEAREYRRPGSGWGWAVRPPGPRRCACARCCRAWGWTAWCWRPTRRTWPRRCTPGCATALCTCRRLPWHWLR